MCHALLIIIAYTVYSFLEATSTSALDYALDYLTTISYA
jgi:hypothetical protein